MEWKLTERAFSIEPHLAAFINLSFLLAGWQAINHNH